MTSAMLCVGAVSVCIVSVMIAGGLAFVGLSESRSDRAAMDYISRSPDAWSGVSSYRGGELQSSGGLSTGARASSPRERFDYFAQPDRVNQDSLVEELDRRYGERLQAMMRELREQGNAGSQAKMDPTSMTLASTQTRGEDPSYLPPAPMTEAERDANAAAERLRRLPHERLPSAEDDDDDESDVNPKEKSKDDPFDELDAEDGADGAGKWRMRASSSRRERTSERGRSSEEGERERHTFGVLAVEEREYAETKKPQAAVNKARERFEQFENTPEWHGKIRRDCDSYVERLREIENLVKNAEGSKATRASKQINLGVEAVRQWHATISRDLKNKLAVMEVALETIADAKSKDKELRVHALSEDIEDELDALTTTMDRVDKLKTALSDVVHALTSAAADASDTNKTETGSTKRAPKSKSFDDEEKDDGEEEDDAADVGASNRKNSWDQVAETWVGGASKPSGVDTSVAKFASKDSASASPSSSSIVDSKKDDKNTAVSLAKQAEGGDAPWVHARWGARASLGSAGDDAEYDDVASERGSGATLGDVLSQIVRSVADGKDSNPKSSRTSTFAALGSAWGSNDWVGTDAADATWDPIRGENDGVYVDDAAKRLDWTIPPGGSSTSKLAQSELDRTPTPDDEDFDEKSKQRAVEKFAQAEHKSAEAWRMEAMKAQQKLEDLAASTLENDGEMKKSAEAVERLKGLVSEFKKALVKESKARAKAEKLLEEESTRSAEEREDLEKRVVEQAKLQILAARAEARDASLARIKAEAEAEKALKEKSELAKAAAKVQVSADKALKTLMADRDAEKEHSKQSSESEYDDDAKAEIGEDADVRDVLNAAAEAAEAAAKQVLKDKGANSSSSSGEKPTTWDSALEDIKTEVAAKGASASVGSDRDGSTPTPLTKSKSVSPKKEADDSDSVDSLIDGAPTFETTIAVSSYDVPKKDVKLFRGATLSLLAARAPGACAEKTMDVKKSTADDGSVRLSIKCVNAKNVEAVSKATEALKWATESGRMGANLVKIGFKSAAAEDFSVV